MTAPTLTGFGPSITFAEADVNAAPQVLDPDAVLTAGTNGFGLATLTISGLLPEDIISLRNQGTGLGQVGLSGSNVTYSGLTIGTLTGGNGSTLTITFGLFAGAGSVGAVIQNLTYANASNTPTLNRTLVFDITDSGGAHLNAHTMSFQQQSGSSNPFDSFVVQFESSPTAVDIDNDGDLDLVVGERFGAFRTLRNDGGGVFTDLFNIPNPFTNWDYGTNSTPAFGDIDNDGDLDLIASFLYEAPRAFANNGSNVFTEVAYPFAGIGLNTAPSFGDVDNDGDKDAVFGAGDGTLRTFRNNGNGSFTELTGASNPFNGVSVGGDSSPSFVDLDGDGDADAVVGANDGTLHSFLNNGSGVFTELTGAANPFNGVDVGLLSAPTFLDVNGDGILDAVVGAYNGTLKTFLGQPFFTFDITVPLDSNAPKVTGLITSATFGENLVNATPQVLDSDVTFTDDDLDLPGGRLTVTGILAEDRVSLLNQGNGANQVGLSGASVTYGGIEIGTLSGGVGTALTIVFNSNAAQYSVDAVIQNLTYANVSDAPTASRTLVLDVTDALGQHLNAVTASFSPLAGAANPFNGADTGFYATPSFVDLDNDGDIDAVVGGDTGFFNAYANNGAGVFTELAGSSNPFNAVGTAFHSAIGFGDLDGDGDMDAVVGDGLGAVRSFANDGAGVFTELTGASNPFDGLNVGNSSTPAFVDLDGDHDMDVVIGERTGTLRSFANDGSGDFTELTGVTNPFNGMNFGEFVRPAFVDIDGDGDGDLVTGQTDGTLRFFENNGSGAFHEQVQSNNPFNGIDVGERSAPGFADLDGDGDMDAVIGKDDGTLLTFENTTPAGAGKTTIVVSVSREVDTFTGTPDNDPLPGTTDADILIGLGGNDTLTGGNGDTMLGGAGNDTYDVGAAGDQVLETVSMIDPADAGGIDTVRSAITFNLDAYAGVRFVENLILTGTNNTDGTGNALYNVLTGNTGNNTLDGGLGNDTMSGGAGNDTYIVNSKNDVVTETTSGAAGGADTVLSGASTFTLGANLEDLTLTGTQNSEGIGNTLANRITGNTGHNALKGLDGNDTLTGGDGDDELRGGTGTDRMNGGNGNDRFFVDVSGDQTIETNANVGTGGIDTVFTTISRTLSANIENLRLQGGDPLSGTGNELGNKIYGNTGANLLKGLAGNDTIEGKDGADTIEGGEGNDTLSGGSQADVFRFAASNTGVDRILDFSKNGDRFDLSGGSFTAISTAANGDTVLTHAGGFIRIATPPNLTLAQWNALVISSGSRAEHQSESAPGGDAAVHAPLEHMATLSHHGDWVYA